MGEPASSTPPAGQTSNPYCLDRAKKHLHDLDGIWRWFRETNPYGFALEKDPDTGKEWRVVTRADPIPLCIPALAGDVVHNLRSALDQLIRQLIVANGAKPHDKSEFPIGHSEADYSAKKPRKTRGISQDAADLLDAFQPYKGGKGAELFWTIHHLDIVDKHRLLLTTAWSHALILRAGGFTVWDKDETEIIADDVIVEEELELTDPPLLRVGSRFEDHENVHITPLVALDERGLGERKPLIWTLEYLVEKTALVIAAFARAGAWGQHSVPNSIGVFPPEV